MAQFTASKFKKYQMQEDEFFTQGAYQKIRDQSKKESDEADGTFSAHYEITLGCTSCTTQAIASVACGGNEFRLALGLLPTYHGLVIVGSKSAKCKEDEFFTQGAYQKIRDRSKKGV